MHTYVLFLFLCICSITCGDYLPNYNKIGTRPKGMQRPTDYPQPSVADLFVLDDGDRLPNTGLRGSRPNPKRRRDRLPPYAKIGTLPKASLFQTGTIAPVYPETINSEILKLILSAGSDMLGK